MSWWKTLTGRKPQEKAVVVEPPVAPAAPVAKPVAAATSQKEIAKLALNFCLRRRDIPSTAIDVLSISQIDRPSGNPAGDVHLRVKLWDEKIAKFLPQICADMLVNLDRFEHAVVHSDFSVRFTLEPGLKFTPTAPVLKKVIKAAPAASAKVIRLHDQSTLVTAKHEPNEPASLLQEQTVISLTGRVPMNDYHRNSPAFATTDIMPDYRAAG